MVNKEISLKVWEENRVLIYAVQGEIDARKLKISFIEQNGNNLNLEGKSVTLYVRKPDGTHIYNNCSIDVNTAIVTITSQMVSTTGFLECEFQIFDSENLLLKINGLKIMVTSKGEFSQAIESTSEYNALTDALNKANTYSQTAVRGIKVNDVLIPEDSDNIVNIVIPENESAVQGIKVNGTSIPCDSNNIVDITVPENEPGIQGIKVNGTSIPCDSENIVNIITANNSIPTFEQGTWTPSFICLGGTNPTYTINYTNSHYYRIGDLVYITFFIYANVTNIGDGSAYIDGLPFIAAGSTDRQAISMSVKGYFSDNTALTITDSQTYLKIGRLDGSDQRWSTEDIYIGGSGFYLKA